jgi:tRNA(Ile)-lysidine synthase
MSSKEKPNDPVSFSEFESLMSPLGPFENSPHMAVGVSGGGDSMALCLLADRWARERSGSITALIVDHGLRSESSNDAMRVVRWLEARAIECVVLKWHGDKPTSGIQEKAREARYRLMTSWARRFGVLHLLLAHNLEDQAETFLLRFLKGSGIYGLSAMSAIAEKQTLRLLRPFLGVSRERLRNTLRAWEQDWLEDPSNDNEAFARVRIRKALPALASAGLPPSRLTEMARRSGVLRRVLERAVSDVLVRSCTVFPEGYAMFDADVLFGAPEPVSTRGLSRLITTIGAARYGPRREKVQRIHRSILQGMEKGATLGGCRIVPDNRRTSGGGTFLVCRENRRPPSRLAVAPGAQVLWDERFKVRLKDSEKKGSAPSAWLARLGRVGWAEVVSERPELKKTHIPWPARVTLPALWGAEGVFEVPHLGYRDEKKAPPGLEIEKISFFPPNALPATEFYLV